MQFRTLAALLCGLTIVGSLQAQSQRYELGRRLRVFEERWEKTPGDEAAKRCATPLNQAVMAFFTFRFGEAGRAIDQARFSLDANAKPTPTRLWAESLALYPAKRLLDAKTRDIAVELNTFYDVPRPTDAEFSLRVTLAIQGKEHHAQTFAIKELPMKYSLQVKDVKEGDHVLQYEIFHAKEKLAHGGMTISFVSQVADRLEKLKKIEKTDGMPATEFATIKAVSRLLGGLLEGKAEETDYPAYRLLHEAEQSQAGKPFYTHKRPGDYWLSLVARPEDKTPERTFPMRVLVPTKWNEKSPPPLVVALHGAGGSENLFFEGYGNGKIVPLCQERGWMLVAPRIGFSLPLGQALDELYTRYPFDRNRVFLIGHSMGAAQAVGAVSLEPRRYAGVVALGGGGSFKASDDLKKVPFFVGVGAQDFARSAARGLKDRLVKAGIQKVTFRELPDVEHLGIVQRSLSESFGFFDEIAKARINQ